MTELTVAAQWLNETFAVFDKAILTFAHNMHESVLGPFFDWFFTAITHLGDAGIFFILLSIALIVPKKTRKIGIAMMIGIIIGSLITNFMLKTLIARPRPYVDESSIFYQWWLDVGFGPAREFSFPSGHTTVAFSSLSVLVFMAKKRWSIPAIMLASIVGFSRNYIFVHYPSDVIGGIIVGLFSAFIAYLIVKKIGEKTANKTSRAALWFNQ